MSYMMKYYRMLGFKLDIVTAAFGLNARLCFPGSALRLDPVHVMLGSVWLQTGHTVAVAANPHACAHRQLLSDHRFGPLNVGILSLLPTFVTASRSFPVLMAKCVRISEFCFRDQMPVHSIRHWRSPVRSNISAFASLADEYLKAP